MATVLLVEDNRDVADMMALALELEGHDVHVEYDGTEGLRAAAHTEPQVAVLDIGLPRLDGIELAHALRQMYNERVLLIACTGMGDVLPGTRIANAGFDHVFVKPVPIHMLASAIDEALSQSATRATPAGTRRRTPGTGQRPVRGIARHAAP